MEFLIRVKGCYTVEDIKKMDFIMFFTALEEAEAEQRAAIEKAKEKQ